MNSISEYSSFLTRNADGIWTAGKESAISYPEEGNELLYAIEPKSFWFRHRNKCITSAARRHLEPGARFMDIGGGNGFVALGLQEAGYDVSLLEPGPKGVKHARERGVQNVIHCTFGDAEFAPGTLPSVGLFDVVEHIEDDAAFLQTIREAQAPGSKVFITVPAYASLWSEDDETAGHYRRYTRTQLAAVMERAGYRIEYATYFFSSTLPLVYAARKSGGEKDPLAKENLEKAHTANSPAMRGALEAALAYEPFLIRSGIPMPFGGSILAVGKNP